MLEPVLPHSQIDGLLDSLASGLRVRRTLDFQTGMVTLADPHLQRVRFFQGLLAGFPAQWSDTRSRELRGRDGRETFYLATARRVAADRAELARYLDYCSEALSLAGKVAAHRGEFARIVDGVNATLDAVMAPIDEAATVLEEVFAEDWSFATGEPLHLPDIQLDVQGTATVAIVPSGPDQPYNASRLNYFSGINAASTSVWLTSPYFIPDEAILFALLGAALRGVDVRILVPQECVVLLVGPAGRSYFHQ